MNFDRIIAVRTSKTVYRDGNKVIKVFDESYSRSDILNEALNQSRIEETGLRIPKILEVTSVEGKWAIVSEFIKGETLARKLEQDPKRESEYLDLFVSLQNEIHSKRSPHLNKLKDKLNEAICEADLDATTRYDLHTRLEAMPKHNKVCHGDFNPSNIILTNDGTPYVLDWSHATQGNASADSARTYLLFRLDGKDALAEEYLRRFCAASETEPRYIQSWFPIVAAAQSVRGNPGQRDFLLHWASVVDYE